MGRDLVERRLHAEIVEPVGSDPEQMAGGLQIDLGMELHAEQFS